MTRSSWWREAYGPSERATATPWTSPRCRTSRRFPISRCWSIPSHASGGAGRVAPLALAAQGVGSDGLIVEVHLEPDSAKTEGPLQLSLTEFAELTVQLGISRLRSRIDLVDREIIRLLARRRKLSLRIGRAKADRGWPVKSASREVRAVAGGPRGSHSERPGPGPDREAVRPGAGRIPPGPGERCGLRSGRRRITPNTLPGPRPASIFNQSASATPEAGPRRPAA